MLRTQRRCLAVAFDHSEQCKCPSCQDELLTLIASNDAAKRSRGRKLSKDEIDVWVATNSLPPEIERALSAADGRLRPFSPMDQEGDL